MGLFDWFGRRPLEPAGDLREALITAFNAQQYDVMARLINANVAAIRESFPEWTIVPKEIRADPEALERYAQTLFTVAGLFERSGDGSLMSRLRAENPTFDTDGTYQQPPNDGTDASMTVSFGDEQGHTLALDELRTAVGQVKWEVCGGPPVPPAARRLHQDGRAAGGRGDYDTAQSLLTRAAELAPLWPYPVYDRAFTHLLQHDFDAALKDYRKTVELAPGGFFTAEVAVDTLTRESTGEFASGLYAAFVTIEHMPTDERCSIAGQLVEKYPSFAPGWNEHADFVTDPVNRLEVIENGLAARPDPHTRGLLNVKKAMTMSLLGDADAAAHMLKDLVSTSTSVSTRMLAELALARLQPALNSICGPRASAHARAIGPR